MTFRSGEFVAYGGRAGRVDGVKAIAAAGACLCIAYTGPAGGVVHVPMDRAARSVTRISKGQAAVLDANIPPVMTMHQNRMQRMRAAKLLKEERMRERLAEMGRLSGLARARKRQA